jgi:hypothetical protein
MPATGFIAIGNPFDAEAPAFPEEHALFQMPDQGIFINVIILLRLFQPGRLLRDRPYRQVRSGTAGIIIQ